MLYLFPFAEPDASYTQTLTSNPAGEFVSDWSGVRDLLVPELTAIRDYAHKALTGLAPPGSLVEATLPEWNPYTNPITRHTYATLSGHYGLDTSDLYLKPYTGGSVLVRDSIGNTFKRTFTVFGYRFFLPAFWR